MEICNKKFLTIIIFIFLSTASYADSIIQSLKNRQTSYLDFFLLKLENKLINKSSLLSSQFFATRVQYSNLAVEVSSDNKKILINIRAIMDKRRYSKKKYIQKISDCNQVRNIIFYKKTGYTFFIQKRDPNLSEYLMKKIFKENFFNNLTLNEKESEMLLEQMHVKVSIYHPVNKTELTCSGKINEYELK